MEDKDNYTKQEVEDIVLAMNKYHKTSKEYIAFLTLGLPQYKDRKESAKKEVKESVTACKEKIPKSLLNKIELIDPK